MHKVGILGSAVVGQTLARGFKTHGHDVRIGSRTPAKLADFSASTGIPAATSADVAKWADLLVLAVHGASAEDALAAAGADNLAGKVVIDTTNPIAIAARRRCDSVLHWSQQLAARTTAGGISARQVRQGVQQRRQVLVW